MRTPFELTGVQSSIAAGEDFLEALAAAHPHVTLQPWGQPSGAVKTRLGIFTVTVGTGAPAVTVIGSIHGDELSGREACMAFARDLAESTDASLQAYLSQHSVSIMATANPAGTILDTRGNGNGVDLNRTYDDLVERETWTINKWMNWAVPVLTVDLHEMWTTDLDAETATGTMPVTVPASLQPLGVELNDLIIDALESAGFTYLAYSSVAGGTLRMHGSPRWGIVSQLIEVNRQQLSMGERIEAHLAGLRAALAHHRANVAAYETAHVGAGGTGGGALPAPPYVPPTQSKTVVRHGVPIAADVSVIRDGSPVPLS